MKWFGRSLLHLILLLLAVSLVSFLLVSMSPVDPLQTNVGQTALGSMAPEQIEKLQAYWGVGVPVWKRFFSWISGICHSDFGISLLYRRPVLEVIAEKASASVWLLLSAWLFSGIVGIFLGIAAAAKRGKWVDRLITGYCIVIAGTPSFCSFPSSQSGSVSRWEWRRTRSAWRIACITHFCRRVRWD